MRSRILLGVVISFTMFVIGVAGHAQQPPPQPSLEGFRHVGKSIHEVTREGYRLSFQLLSQEEKRATLPPAQEQEDSRENGREHLMLFVLSPEGRFVTDASVRISVTSPEGNVREAPAAPMAGGYGIDARLHAQGTYELRAEIQVTGQTIVEAFSYTRP